MTELMSKHIQAFFFLNALPANMAQEFVACTDTEELIKLRKLACDVVDYAPHSLDNYNATLLMVLLILDRSEITRRFETNGPS